MYCIVLYNCIYSCISINYNLILFSSYHLHNLINQASLPTDCDNDCQCHNSSAIMLLL